MSDKFTNPLPGVPSVESPFFKRIFDDPAIDAETRRIAHDLNRDGFAVLDFPDPDFERIAENIKRDLDGHYNWSQWRDTGYDKGHGMRVMEGWKFNENVRRLATNQRIIDILTTLFGRKAWPFQTLNFPVGTQQHFHTDSVHFSSVPERFMCGVWTALEDISEDAGPLVYYPGSHKWPIYTNEHIGVCSIEAEEQVHQHTFEPTWRELVKEFDIKPQVFTPRKGQSLIWLSNLLHGGNKQANKNKTRWSQVTHYYFEGCAYYTPMHSDPFYGNIKFRELTDMMTGETVKNQYAGYDISPSFLEQSRAGFRSAIVHLPEGFSPELYLEANPDVRDAGADPVQHYLNHGFVERRRIKP